MPPPLAKPHPVVTLLLVPSPTQLNVAVDSHGHSDLSHWNSQSLTLWGFSAFPDNQTACPMSILSPILPNLGSVTFSVKWWILNIFGFEGHHLCTTTTQLCSLENQSLCPEPYMISSLTSDFPCFLPYSYFQLNSYWNRTEKLEANRKQRPQTTHEDPCLQAYFPGSVDTLLLFLVRPTLLFQDSRARPRFSLHQLFSLLAGLSQSIYKYSDISLHVC